MKTTALPYRERWTGWVTFAWVLAMIAIIGGIAIIVTAGFIEVPRLNSFGRTETSTEPNVFIWALAIGQAVSALMLAALFSIINSIYQNSCDHLAEIAVASPEQSMPQPEPDDVDEVEVAGEWDGEGLKVLSVHASSQLHGVLKGGYVLTKVNDTAVKNEIQAAQAVFEGYNAIEYVDNSGAMKRRMITMEPAPLHIQFKK